MHNVDSMIMVINRGAEHAENVKELIEFMDAPYVCTSTPHKWLKLAGETRLEAVFVGPDLSDRVVKEVVGGVGKLDPNIPIVMLNNRGAGC